MVDVCKTAISALPAGEIGLLWHAVLEQTKTESVGDLAEIMHKVLESRVIRFLSSHVHDFVAETCMGLVGFYFAEVLSVFLGAKLCCNRNACTDSRRRRRGGSSVEKPKCSRLICDL